jgi:hypothetical protein
VFITGHRKDVLDAALSEIGEEATGRQGTQEWISESEKTRRRTPCGTNAIMKIRNVLPTGFGSSADVRSGHPKMTGFALKTSSGMKFLYL